MERENLLSYSSVRRRARRVFRLRRPLAEYLRGVLAGAAVAFTMAETVAYQHLDTAVRGGQLPSYTIDASIVVVSVIEGLWTPLLTVLARRKRRLVLMCAMLVPAVLVLFTLAAPQLNSAGSELCVPGVQRRAGAAVGGIEGRALTLLVLMLGLAAGAALARAAVFTQGLAYLDEHAPDHLLLHFGVLTALRVMALVSLPRVLSVSAGAGAAAAGVTGPLVLHALQLLLVPARAPSTARSLHVPHDDESVWRSLGRVLSNAGAMCPAIGAVLLASALWGFVYHETDIIQTQFLMSREHSALAGQAVLIRCAVLIMAVVLVAKYNAPTTPDGPLLDKPAVLKLATQVTLATVPLYILLVTVARCERGLLAPAPAPGYCSDCSCDAPWMRFNPVCVSDQATTYYSPCLAGCSSADDVGGLQTYRNCSCAAPGVGGAWSAARGACGAVQCAPTLQLFETLVLLVLVLSVVALQCLGTTSVRAVQPRDRATALGVLAGLLAMLAFASSHVLYRTIAGWTCAWRVSVSARCELQSAWFAYAAGGSSAGLALLSAALCLLLWLRARIERDRTKAPLETVAEAPIPAR